MRERDPERLRELRILSALGELAPQEELELSCLWPEHPVEPDAYELAAAAVLLAFSAPAHPLPDGLRQRVQRSARELLSHDLD